MNTVKHVYPSKEVPLTKFVWFTDLHIGYASWNIGEIDGLFLKMNSVVKDADFILATGDEIDVSNQSGVDIYNGFVSNYITKAIYTMQGNHDVPYFTTHQAWEVNGVKFIYFHADYVAIQGDPDPFFNTGNVTADELIWIEDQLKTGGNSHKILLCHWSIVTSDPVNFKWPITDDHGRTQILALAEKYGVKLYLNGHEHNTACSVGMVGVLADVNAPSCSNGSFMVCTVYPSSIDIQLYGNRVPFRYIKTVSVPLT